MAENKSLEIISKDIEELQNLLRNLKNYSEIPKIEIDLALSKMQNIYELMLLLKDNSIGFSLEQPDHTKPDEEPDNSTSQRAVPKEPADKRIEKQEPVHIIDKKNIDPSEKKNEANQEKILAEKLEKPGNYINEKIGSPGNDLSAKILSSPIQSIAGSMGINDKFFFIRELFGGNANQFRTVMNALDEAANFNEAYNLLLNNMGWDMESDSVKQLLNLVRRKFIHTSNE